MASALKAFLAFTSALSQHFDAERRLSSWRATALQQGRKGHHVAGHPSSSKFFAVSKFRAAPGDQSDRLMGFRIPHRSAAVTADGVTRSNEDDDLATFVRNLRAKPYPAAVMATALP